MLRSEISFTCTITRQGTFVAVDPIFASFLGYREDELAGMHITEVVAAPYRDDLWQIYKEKAEGILEQTSYDIEFLNKDGAMVRAHVSTRAVKKRAQDVVLAASIRRLPEEFEADQRVQPCANVVSLLQHDGPLVGIDKSLSVVVWNQAAAQAFGQTAREAIGCPCWDAVAGRDSLGNLVCSPDCDVALCVANDEPPPSDLRAMLIGKGAWSATFTTAPVDDPERGRLLFHAFQLSAVAPDPSSTIARQPLTERHRQILRLLEQGFSTQEIADELYLSVSTVRNHSKECMRRLGARSRLTAVVRARQAGLL